MLKICVQVFKISLFIQIFVQYHLKVHQGQGHLKEGQGQRLKIFMSKFLRTKIISNPINAQYDDACWTNICYRPLGYHQMWSQGQGDRLRIFM